MANAEIRAPSLAIFVRGTHEVGAFIELLCQHQRETENKEKENKFWILHGCIFRLAYGRVTSGEMVNPSSGTRTTMPTSVSPNLEASVRPHPAPLAITQADTINNISEIDGSCDVESRAVLKPTSGADNYDVHRMGLAETRVVVFHLSSYTWSNANAYAELCGRWIQFLATCVEHQVDFLTWDGNLFSQRNFKKDDHSDFRSCSSDSLAKLIWTEVPSTQAGELIKSMEGDRDAECDSRILISLCYGKQTVICEERSQQQSASADGWVGSAFDTEITLIDVEQPKHLLNCIRPRPRWNWRCISFTSLDDREHARYEEHAHPISSSRITARRPMARKEC